MVAANESWHVAPHRPLEPLSANVWRLEGTVVRTPLKRVMTLARRSDGGLVVHSAIAVDKQTMNAITELGEIRAIVVPNAFHRLDARVFHARFPDAQVVCPPGARKAVEQVVPVDATYDSMAQDTVVELQVLEGTKGREGVMIVREPSGATLVFNDLVFNMPHVGGVQGFALRHITGSSGGPRITRIAKLFLIHDKRALRGHLERLAALPGLRRIIVSHHEVIDQQPGAVLAGLAGGLA